MKSVFHVVVGLSVVTSVANSGTLFNTTRSSRAMRDAGETHKSTCWVFSHMNKSGGMTIRKLLRSSFGERRLLYDRVWSGREDGILPIISSTRSTR